MQFVTVRELRLEPGKVWQRLRAAHDLVVTSRGRPIALMTSVGEDQLEESLLVAKQARAIQAVAKMQRHAVDRGWHRTEGHEIEAHIRAVRRSRRR